MCKRGRQGPGPTSTMIGLCTALVGPVSRHALLKAAYAHGVRVQSNDEETADVD